MALSLLLPSGTIASAAASAMPDYLPLNQSPSGPGIISTAAGGGSPNVQHFEGEPALDALLSAPVDVAFDKAGNMYILESVGNTVRMVDSKGNITTVLGPEIKCLPGSGDPLPGVNVPTVLGMPQSIVLDSKGNLYIALYQFVVLRLDTSGVLSVFAGTWRSNGSSGDGAPAINAKLMMPCDLACDSKDNIFIVDNNLNIRKVNTEGIISTIAGFGASELIGNDYITEARLRSPKAIAIDRSDNIYVSTTDGSIKKINRNGSVSTIISREGTDISSEGIPARSARLNTAASQMGIDKSNNLYFSEDTRIRMIDTTGKIRTIAGKYPNDNTLLTGDGASAVSVTLGSPAGLTFDREGNLFFADSNRNRIRKVQMVSAIGSEAYAITAENRFLLEIRDGSAVYYRGVFSEMKDLGSETEKVASKLLHKDSFGLVTNGRTQYLGLKLKREMTASSRLAQWAQKVEDNAFAKKNGYLSMYDKNGNLLAVWKLSGVWPSGLTYNADDWDDERYMEEVELTLDKIARVDIEQIDPVK